MKNFYQVFRNIVSRSGWPEDFSENPDSGDYSVDLMRDVLSRVLHMKQLVKNCR
jgi:hypothetical protein